MEGENHAFLGTGWHFPVEPDATTGRIRMCSGEDDIVEAIHLILQTKKGERAMRPDFGSQLYQYTFESFSQSVRSSIAEEIKNTLISYEARIQDIQVAVRDGETEGCILIEVGYVVRATNNPYNIVFPFYLEEGSG